jgi:ribose-phosphate pyrophosphokinase
VLTAVPVLAAALARELPPAAVLVAPDLGAVKLAERYADVLDLPIAVVRKKRISGTEVQARELVGDVDGRTAVIVDDMISTGATVEAAVHVVTSNGARPDVLVAATHGVLAGPARDVLGRLPIAHLVLTDTLAFDPDPLPRVEVVSVARLLADAICGLASPAVPPPLARLGLEGIARHV